MLGSFIETDTFTHLGTGLILKPFNDGMSVAVVPVSGLPTCEHIWAEWIKSRYPLHELLEFRMNWLRYRLLGLGVIHFLL